jgi:site-specific DNA-methyltransferase (adenine-specific)
MAIRLLELHRVLRPTGGLYLHCDPSASHYLKILMDGIFGADCFKNEKGVAILERRRTNAKSYS